MWRGLRGVDGDGERELVGDCTDWGEWSGDWRAAEEAGSAHDLLVDLLLLLSVHFYQLQIPTDK